jgi:hypothetical protein
MEIDEYRVETLMIEPEEHSMMSHVEILNQARDQYDGTVTVVGLAS